MKLEKKLTILLVFLIVFGIFYAGVSMINKTSYSGRQVPSIATLSSQIILHDNEKIEIYGDCLRIDNVEGTHSMEPTFGKDHKLIVTTCFTQDNLSEGDIIGYEHYTGSSIVHRIVEIDEDSKGWYAITQGDNLNYKDDKIRFYDIQVLIIGVLY